MCSNSDLIFYPPTYLLQYFLMLLKSLIMLIMNATFHVLAPLFKEALLNESLSDGLGKRAQQLLATNFTLVHHQSKQAYLWYDWLGKGIVIKDNHNIIVPYWHWWKIVIGCLLWTCLKINQGSYPTIFTFLRKDIKGEFFFKRIT